MIDCRYKVLKQFRILNEPFWYATAHNFQPLLAVYQWLKTRGAVQVHICESLCREQQILPSRTRPVMQQFVTGGYMLSAVKVEMRAGIRAWHLSRHGLCSSLFFKYCFDKSFAELKKGGYILWPYRVKNFDSSWITESIVESSWNYCSWKLVLFLHRENF